MGKLVGYCQIDRTTRYLWSADHLQAVPGFLLHHSRDLDDWECDVLSILRDEAAEFAPHRRTRIANEGFACWGSTTGT